MDGRANVILEFQRDAGLKARQRNQRFDNYQAAPGNKDALEAARAVAAAFSHGGGSGGLLLVGGVGCGKTHLGAAIINDVLDNWQMSAERIREAEGGIGRFGNRYGDNPPKVALISTVEMLARIRAAFDGRNDYGDSAQDVINRYSRIKLLILDDMGTEKPTDWANERLFEVIDNRYNENLPTIITTNLPPEALKKVVGDRIYDRIREMCKLFTITEASHRPTA